MKNKLLVLSVIITIGIILTESFLPVIAKNNESGSLVDSILVLAFLISTMIITVYLFTFLITNNLIIQSILLLFMAIGDIAYCLTYVLTYQYGIFPEKYLGVIFISLIFLIILFIISIILTKQSDIPGLSEIKSFVIWLLLSFVITILIYVVIQFIIGSFISLSFVAMTFPFYYLLKFAFVIVKFK